MTALPQSHSPDGLAFGPRRKSFEIEAALATDWHGGSAFRTAWFNAMSMLFPLGEKFFIDSVRHFVNDIEDPKLLEEIAAFQAQEATHRRQHQRYNEMLCELRGYDLDRIERNERERIDWAYRELSARRRLAGTTASEHLTAILADEMLTRKEPMAGADPAVASLWLWHGIEETEHKAVAFDVHVAVGGPVKERRHALILNTFFFLKDTMRNLCIMLQKDGKLWSFREWAVDSFTSSSSRASCAASSYPGSGLCGRTFIPGSMTIAILSMHGSDARLLLALRPRVPGESALVDFPFCSVSITLVSQNRRRL